MASAAEVVGVDYMKRSEFDELNRIPAVKIPKNYKEALNMKLDFGIKEAEGLYEFIFMNYTLPRLCHEEYLKGVKNG